METIPLFSHGPTATLAIQGGVPIGARRFLADARHVASILPAGHHVLNACADRYRFAVGLAACLLAQRVSLLPSAQTPEVIGQLAAFAPDACCLSDDRRCDIGLPTVHYPAPLPVCEAPWEVPAIPTAQLAAIVFTSGSTGVPLPHRKTWGALARGVRAGAERLGLAGAAPHVLLGTVPPQHMYGFEFSILLALLHGHALCAERPFYPADIAAALDAAARPRALVTTPVHLRTLLASQIAMPAADVVVSATAPLSQDLARAVEARFRTRLLEIYGSTETGQIASRRTAESATWRLLPGVRLSGAGDRVFAHGGHVEQPTALQDVFEITGEQQFLLLGRTDDLVEVAGKRSSFGYLNAQLNAISGVTDGIFFLRDDAAGATGVARLGAVVVAPSLSAAELSAQLRQRIDPVFLPRPLILTDRLPRNATGKLPRRQLEELQRQHAQQRHPPLRHLPQQNPPEQHPQRQCSQPAEASLPAVLEIASEHPAFAGHFPGCPVLPGAVLLDEALHAIELARGIEPGEWRIASAKFLEPVRPGDAVRLQHAAPDGGPIRFTLRVADRVVASGSLTRTASQDGAA